MPAALNYTSVSAAAVPVTRTFTLAVCPHYLTLEAFYWSLFDEAAQAHGITPETIVTAIFDRMPDHHGNYKAECVKLDHACRMFIIGHFNGILTNHPNVLEYALNMAVK